MKFFKELETNRLFLRNISSEDREFIFTLFSNDKVNQYLFDAEPLTNIQGADEIIDFYTQAEPFTQHRWILVRKSDGTKLGTCGFHCWDKHANCCEVGYDLAPEYWGNGYMNEVMKTIITFAKDIMKVVKINACVYPENDNSIKLLEKHGFVFNGQMKDEIFRGKKYPHKIYVFQEETMDYIKTNKAAWEEVFDNRADNYGENNHEILKSEKFAFFDSDLKDEIASMDFKGKHVAQFCCNNGRELLSLVLDGGAESGTGFDIAENILNQAKQTAEKAGITNCEFVNCNILEIPEKYYNKFDLIYFTIGAIVWFQDLNLLFEKAGKCLRSGGKLLINDGHPFCFMLAHPGEPEFDENNLSKFDHSYFRKEPWLGNQMGYIAGDYENQNSTFTDYSHTLGDIINALSANGMKTVRLDEYDYDVSDGNLDVYKGKGIPLSYILVAEKD